MDCHPILAAVSDDDREVVLAVVSKDGERLKCASEALRGDREVVLTAVIQNSQGTGVCLRCSAS